MDSTTLRLHNRWRAGENQGEEMGDIAVGLGSREQQIVELLLQGCDNEEIAKQLNMARRTVKAYFNRLFLRFGITTGIKRVKLATLLYRRQLCLEKSIRELSPPMNENSKSSHSFLRDSKIGRSQMPSEPPSTSSRTIFVASTTNSVSGTASNSPSGMKRARMNRRSARNVVRVWESRMMGLGRMMLPRRSNAK